MSLEPWGRKNKNVPKRFPSRNMFVEIASSGVRGMPGTPVGACQEKPLDQIEPGGKGNCDARPLPAQPSPWRSPRQGRRKRRRPADRIPPAVGSGIPDWVQEDHFSVLMNWSIVIAGRGMLQMVPRHPNATATLIML